MKKGQRAAPVPLFLLLCLGLSWAVRLLAIKAVSQHGASPLDLAAAATVGIVILLTFVNFARSKLPPIGARHVRFYTLAGLFGFGLPFLLEFAVAPHLPAVLFVIIVTSTPVWAVLIAAIFRLEPPSWRRAFAIAAGFAATTLVVVGTSNGTAGDGLLSQSALVIAAFGIPILYAVYVLYIAAAWPSDLDSIQGAQGQSTVALAIFAACWLALSERGLGMGVIGHGSSLAVIVIAEIVALLLLFHLARSHGGTFTAQANYVAVVSGSLIGLLLFDQEVNVFAIAGVLVLVLALRLSSGDPIVGREARGTSDPG